MMVSDGAPVRVRDSEMNSLLSLKDSQGYIRLRPRFSSGDEVVVGEGGGGFFGVAGIVQGMPSTGRVKVLLSVLGRPVTGEFREDVLSFA